MKTDLYRELPDGSYSFDLQSDGLPGRRARKHLEKCGPGSKPDRRRLLVTGTEEVVEANLVERSGRLEGRHVAPNPNLS